MNNWAVIGDSIFANAVGGTTKDNAIHIITNECDVKFIDLCVSGQRMTSSAAFVNYDTGQDLKSTLMYIRGLVGFGGVIVNLGQNDFLNQNTGTKLEYAASLINLGFLCKRMNIPCVMISPIEQSAVNETEEIESSVLDDFRAMVEFAAVSTESVFVDGKTLMPYVESEHDGLHLNVDGHLTLASSL
jgi:hypothetical protein